MPAIREKGGMGVVALGAGHVHWSPAGSGHASNHRVTAQRGSKYDHVVPIPRSTTSIRNRADRLRWTASAAIFFKLPCAKNPMELLSGDQKGYVASSVNGRGSGWRASIACSQSPLAVHNCGDRDGASVRRDGEAVYAACTFREGEAITQNVLRLRRPTEVKKGYGGESNQEDARNDGKTGVEP